MTKIKYDHWFYLMISDAHHLRQAQDVLVLEDKLIHREKLQGVCACGQLVLDVKHSEKSQFEVKHSIKL